MEGLQHKTGCLGDLPGYVHRVPIGCVTHEDLVFRLSQLKEENERLNVVNQTLKAKLYDFEHAEE